MAQLPDYAQRIVKKMRLYLRQHDRYPALRQLRLLLLQAFFLLAVAEQLDDARKYNIEKKRRKRKNEAGGVSLDIKRDHVRQHAHRADQGQFSPRPLPALLRKPDSFIYDDAQDKSAGNLGDGNDGVAVDVSAEAQGEAA